MTSSGIYTRVDRIMVLFVDDDADTLFAYQTVTGGDGINAEIASNGSEAISLANALHPDVIVLDLGLPGMGGFEVLRQLRASERTRGIPVIIVTGNDSEELDAAVRESGCEGHLLKPCSADVLLHLVNVVAIRARKPAADLAKAEGSPQAAVGAGAA